MSRKRPDPASSLGHRPAAPWVFDESVAACFDDMLARSVPDLAGMRATVADVGASFVRRNTDVVDLGAATGDALAAQMVRRGADARYVAVEPAPAFRPILEERFVVPIRERLLTLWMDRLGPDWYPPARASLTLCCLTLQFCPVEDRPAILRRAFDATEPGGALVLVEKVAGSSARSQAMLRSHHYDHKRHAGYSHEAVEAKAASLEHVLVPLQATWNEDLLRRAGFGTVECIWRRLNFAAWVAVKD